MKHRKWTSWGKPIAPDKPRETLWGDESLYYCQLKLDNSITISDEMHQAMLSASEIKLSTNKGDDEFYIDEYYIDFLSKKDAPNPHYEEQLEQYKQKYTEYREELKWWNAEKKKHDAMEAIKAEERERKQLKRLKEKYEP